MAVRKVGTAKLLKEVGRGGMGVVHEAEQEVLGRRVAIKELTPEVAGSAAMVERFKREARAYAALRHEAIPAIHDLVEKNDGLYMVTEFVTGADVQKVLKAGGPLPPECVAVIGARVADALAHVHLRGLLHRDIKPANVMVTADGSVKLMDFGIAFDAGQEALTREGLAVGSPPYMSPESLSGQRGDARSDLWSLGVMLYELLSGERPFRAADTAGLYALVSRGKHMRLGRKVRKTPRALVRVVERCLEVAPDARPPDARQVADALHTEAMRLLKGTHAHVRLAAMMVHRGLVSAQELDATLVDAAALKATVVLDADFTVDVVVEEPRSPLRVALVGASLAAAAGGAAWWAHLQGLIRLPF